MKKQTKKLIATLLVVLTFLTAAPLDGFVGFDLIKLDRSVKASAAYNMGGTLGKNVIYAFDGDTGELVISGNGDMKNYYGYYFNDYSPFHNDSRIKSVIIENGITSIGNLVFCGCTGITSVTIPDSVTTIGEYAFSDCIGLISVTIPNSVITIGKRAFSDCAGLTNVTIGDSVTSIEAYAFENCTGLTSVTLPDSITHLSGFNGCTGLTSINIPDGVTYIAGFEECTGLTSISIPGSVTEIASWTFYNCRGLTSITIPDSVTTIGKNAFYDCIGLTSINIPDGLTCIKSCAFFGCTGLTSIEFPDGVTYIGSQAFSDCCALTSLTIPENVKEIGRRAFSNCKNLKKLNWNAMEVKNFDSEDGVFWDAGSNTEGFEVVFGDKVKSIPAYIFWSEGYDFDSPNIKAVKMSDSIESIGDFAFCRLRNLTDLTIGKNVTTIGESAFARCSGLTSVPIPSGVTEMGRYSFSECTGLKNVIIPDSVKNIDIGTFESCTGLTSVTIPNSVESIGGAFSRCTGLTSVTIPDGVKSIGTSAFFRCTGLTSVTIPNSVESIDSDAFYGCNALANVKLPDGLKSIGDGAFGVCSNLTDIAVPDSVEFIGEGAFSATPWYTAQPDGEIYLGKVFYKYKGTMPENTDIVIKNGTKGISGEAFFECTGLKSITIPDGVTSIGYRAFTFCSGLTTLTIPGSVKSIDNEAFGECTALTSVVICDGTTSISSEAFGYCDALKSMIIPKSVKNISENATIGCQNLTIYGYALSAAQTYARDEGFPFVTIDESRIDPTKPIGPGNNGKILPEGYDFSEDSYNFENYSVDTISKGYFLTIFEPSTGELLYKKMENCGKGGVCFGMSYTTAAIYSGFPNVKTFAYRENYLSDVKIATKIRDLKRDSLFGAKSGAAVDGAYDDLLTVSDYIKYAHIYHLSEEYWNSTYENALRHFELNPQKLLDVVDRYIEDDKIGVVLNLQPREGISNAAGAHAVLVVGRDGNDLLIDDPNATSNLQRLTINSDWSWTFGRYNSHDHYIVWSVDVFYPYKILYTGEKVVGADYWYTEKGKAVGSTETEHYVEGMERLSSEYALASVSSSSFEIGNTDYTEIRGTVGEGEETAETTTDRLFWVSSEETFNVSGLSDDENVIEYAGDNTILSAVVEKDASVTMNINGDNIESAVKTELGNKLTLSFETVDESGDTAAFEISGTACSKIVSGEKTETGCVVEGLSNVEITYLENDETISNVTAEVENGESFTVTLDETDDSIDVDLTSQPDPEPQPEPTNPSANCSCNCHKKGIKKLFFKIVLIFQRIFKKNKTCKCGARHY